MPTIFVVGLFTPASGLLHTCCQYLFNFNPFTSVFSRVAIVLQCKILKFGRLEHFFTVFPGHLSGLKNLLPQVNFLFDARVPFAIIKAFFVLFFLAEHFTPLCFLFWTFFSFQNSFWRDDPEVFLVMLWFTQQGVLVCLVFCFFF